MKNLRNIRKNRGLTQVELARRVGLSSSAICQYETEERHPSIKTVKKIARELDCKLEDLIDDG